MPHTPDESDQQIGPPETQTRSLPQQKASPSQFLPEGEDGIDCSTGDQALNQGYPQGVQRHCFHLPLHLRYRLGRKHMLVTLKHSGKAGIVGNPGQEQADPQGGKSKRRREKQGSHPPFIWPPTNAQCGNYRLSIKKALQPHHHQSRDEHVSHSGKLGREGIPTKVDTEIKESGKGIRKSQC